jgi:putative aldouronate transport system permease protein
MLRLTKVPKELENNGIPSLTLLDRSSAGNSRLGRFLRAWKHNGVYLLMAAPALLLLIVFNYLPLIGTVVAFKNYKFSQGIFGSEWVGLKNFSYLFGSDTALRITFNTITLNAIFIITGIAASLIIALLLNEVRAKVLARFYQSAVFMPYFISWVIAGLFMFALLNANNGMIDNFLAKLGQEPISFYNSPQYWPFILSVTNLWKSAGYWSIIYLAGMLAINNEYYEAAMIDGASRWKQIKSITLPLLMPIISINLLLSIGRIFYADFGLFFYVTRNSSLLYQTTDVIDTYVFRALRSSGDFGMSSAAGLYQSIVGFILIVTANWLIKRIDPEKGIF